MLLLLGKEDESAPTFTTDSFLVEVVRHLAEPRPRLVFLLVSCIFAVAVLFAHVHYSIDVFAAPFMAYGMFEIAKRLFPRDFELITNSPKNIR